MLLLCASNSYARLETDLNYTLDTLSSKNEESEIYSRLDFSMQDAFHATRYEYDYSLQSDYIYEHETSERNARLAGDITTRYHFFNSLNWFFDASFENLSTDVTQQVSDSETQIHSFIETGPTLHYARGRGEFSLTLASGINSYSESELDSSVQRQQVSYEYPLSSSHSVSLLYVSRFTEYDVQTANDNELNSVIAEFTRRNHSFNYRIFIQKDKVEQSLTKESSSGESYGITTDYAINNRSTVSTSLLSRIETVEEFNRNASSPDNIILSTGLIKNDEITIRYMITSTSWQFSAGLYQNEISNVFNSTTASQKLSGATIDYNQQLNNRLNFLASVSTVFNERVGRNAESVDVSFVQTLNRARKLNSHISLLLENDTEHGESTNNVSINFQMTYNIF